MKRAILIPIALTIPSPSMAHGGHWHLDGATLEKIFAAADGIYAWFVSHTLAIAALPTALLLVRWTVRVLQQYRNH